MQLFIAFIHFYNKYAVFKCIKYHLIHFLLLIIALIFEYDLIWYG